MAKRRTSRKQERRLTAARSGRVQPGARERSETEAGRRMGDYHRRRGAAYKRLTMEQEAANAAYDRNETDRATWRRQLQVANDRYDRTSAALNRWILRGPH